MQLYDYLLETFGENTPFFTTDIKFGTYSKPWIYKELNKLCGAKKVIRFERGIYYIPVQTALGASVLSPYKIIEKKYIFDGKQVIGYYSGISFLNQLGLPQQMSNVIEVYTNNETSNVRDIMIGKQKILLRKARTSVNCNNVAILRFLEIMNALPLRFVDEEKQKILQRYLKDNEITRKDISKYAPLFPDKAIRNLVESELIYYVAQ